MMKAYRVEKQIATNGELKLSALPFQEGDVEVIILDTHLWIWLADENERLTEDHRDIIEEERRAGLGVSAISCWEVAKLVEYERLKLACPVEEWMMDGRGAGLTRYSTN